MQIARWGNSLAVRIPAGIVKALGLSEGDEVELRALSGKELVLLTASQRRAEALERIKNARWQLPADYRFDRDEVNERGPDPR